MCAQDLQKSGSHLRILRRQIGDLKQIPHWGRRNIGLHSTKFSYLGHLTPEFVHLWVKKYNAFCKIWGIFIT
jgi:hypothetical protein